MLFLLSCEGQLRCLLEFSFLQLRFLKKARQLSLNQEGKGSTWLSFNQYDWKEAFQLQFRCINKYKEKERTSMLVGSACT